MNKMKKLFLCILMSITMIVGTAMPASAAFNIGLRYADKSTANYVYFTLKPTAGETLAKFTMQNMTNGNRTVKSTTRVLAQIPVGRNVWYKTLVQGYNRNNRLVSSRTIYLANDTNLKVAQYGSTTRARLTWNYVNGSNGYKVYMSTDSGKTWKLQKTTTSNSFITPALQKYQNYYFMVLAYKKVGSTIYWSARPDRFPGIYFRTVYR